MARAKTLTATQVRVPRDISLTYPRNALRSHKHQTGPQSVWPALDLYPLW